MNKFEYDKITPGTSIDEIEEQIGKPYKVIPEKDGSVTLQYVERIEVGPGIVELRLYTLHTSEGKVIEKDCKVNSGSVDFRIN